jgi:hypothetical protein
MPEAVAQAIEAPSVVTAAQPAFSWIRSNRPAMRFSAGRHPLPHVRPSMLVFMWQMT